MIRRPLFFAATRPVGVTAVLVGALLSGCSDSGTGVSSANDAVTETAKETVAKVTPAVQAAPGGDFASAWGPAVGSTIPMLAATDQTGAPRDLSSLTGDKGLLLVFSRSADW